MRLLFLLSLLIAFTGCDRKPEASTDIDLLAKLINLPARPMEACFVVETLGDGIFGPSDYIVTAFVHFKTEARETINLAAPPVGDALNLRMEAKSVSSCKTLAASLPIMPLCRDRLGVTCTPGQRRREDSFFKSPYLQGAAYDVTGTDWFVVVLNTK